MKQRMKNKRILEIFKLECRKKQPNISIDSLFDFFKIFNEAPDIKENDNDLLDIEPHFINTLNM